MTGPQRSLDPRRPLVIDTHDLARRPGEMRELHREVPAPAELGIQMIGVLEGEPLDLELKLESVVEGVLATGEVAAELTGECSRCLCPIVRLGRFDLTELYYYPGKDAEEDAEFVVNDMIDLEPAIRSAIVLELPFSPLCRPDCAGLCQVCGVSLNDDPDHTHDGPIDSRWAKLAGFPVASIDE